jgi:hypothetical protein
MTEQEDPKATPHDLVTRKILGDPEITGNLLEEYGDPGVFDALDLSALRPEPVTWIDDGLKETIADLAFSTKFKNSDRPAVALIFVEQRVPQQAA